MPKCCPRIDELGHKKKEPCFRTMVLELCHKGGKLCPRLRSFAHTEKLCPSTGELWPNMEELCPRAEELCPKTEELCPL